jgi:mannose-6-phosphate isomerase-like protein (cupin superfamily)|tara:strand:- start:1346 stop:1732 length:387 start_codon:yes stop_codon:yes gene_type:complete
MDALSKPKIVNKEWGHEIWLVNNRHENYCGKILFIKEGHSTSMHFHAKKHESFYILEGELNIELIDTETTKKHEISLSIGEVFSLDRLMPHRLKAVVSDVKFIEISTYHEDSDSYRVYREPKKEFSIT